MELKDFKDHGALAYETTCNIWGKDAPVHVFLDGGLTKENCPLEDIVSRVNDVLETVSERGDVAAALKRGGMIDRAEEWVSEADQVTDDGDCDRYIIDGGVEVRLPITLEVFAESLRIDSLGVDFKGSVDNYSAEVFIYCSPDYFAGHSMELCINEDGSMECRGLAG